MKLRRLRAIVAEDGSILRKPLTERAWRDGRRGDLRAPRAGSAQADGGEEAGEAAAQFGLSPGGRPRLGLEVQADEREPDEVDRLREAVQARRREAKGLSS